jgi:dTDP-4-amino-4,6-dideoxygalactose transaminase
MNSLEAIPFVDLTAIHSELETELLSTFQIALRSSGFVGGAVVEDFENAFAGFCGARYSVGVGNGTDALRLALIAAGVSPGDTVITVPNTFIATTEAITQAGAIPDFVDVDEATYNMDPQRLREYLETRCRKYAQTGKPILRSTGSPVSAVVPVHLYGQMAEMDAILAIAREHHLLVIEDACQAHGAEYFSRSKHAWLRAGSVGHAAAFSFYPGKNLGACGEAGAVTTDDERLALKVRMLRDHGQSAKYHHDQEGYNSRLDAIQAGILRIKLNHLETWNRLRRQNADRYYELFTTEGNCLILPDRPQHSRSVYHLYVVRAPDRDGLRLHLANANIGTGIHYPIPLHLQKAYSHLGHKSRDYPIVEKVASEIVSLPMYPTLRLDQQRRVVSETTDFFRKKLKTDPAAKFATSAN